jgi:hypothetical protein
VSAVNLLIYTGFVTIVATDRLGPTPRRRLLPGASLLMVLGILGNLTSPSPVERIWAPVAAPLALVLWRFRGAH